MIPTTPVTKRGEIYRRNRGCFYKYPTAVMEMWTVTKCDGRDGI